MKRITVVLLPVALLFVFTGCSGVVRGVSGRYNVPENLIGKVASLRIETRSTACTAPLGTVVRIWFADSDTVRFVRSDGVSGASADWSFQREGASGLNVTITLPSQAVTKLYLHFGSASKGTFVVTERVPNQKCPRHAYGSFWLQLPEGIITR